MNKNNDILKSNHTAQMNWLTNQLAKNNTSIFLNPIKSIKAWDNLLEQNMGQIGDQELYKFITRYLSESGLKKLYTTLRVAKSRQEKNSFRLQCNIDHSSNYKLDKLVAETGLTKGKLLSKLIAIVDVKLRTNLEHEKNI